MKWNCNSLIITCMQEIPITNYVSSRTDELDAIKINRTPGYFIRVKCIYIDGMDVHVHTYYFSN